MTTLDQGYTTPEGFYLPRSLLLPDARAFSDVLEYLGDWNETSGEQYQPRTIDTGDAGPRNHRTANEIGPYCRIDLSQLGGARRSIAVRATDAVIDVVTPRIVTPDDALSFSIIGHKDRGRALVILQHGYIIGSHWLAYIDPATIPGSTTETPA